MKTIAYIRVSKNDQDVNHQKLAILQKATPAFGLAQFAQRHEQAYEKVQDIANRAVAAAKREFISVPVTNRMVSDQDERSKS